MSGTRQHGPIARADEADESDALLPITRMRRAVVASVSASALIPQYNLAVDISTRRLVDAVTRARTAAPGVSLVDFVAAATAHALGDHPLLNATYTPDGVLVRRVVNLAFIVEIEDGMVTPVIADAANLTVAELAARRQELTGAAQRQRLRPADVADGTFTVSNLGPLGIDRFTAMVLPGQSGVLAVGSVSDTGSLTLTLTCDHRVVDGAPAARFLRQLGDSLNDSEWLETSCGSTPLGESTQPSPAKPCPRGGTIVTTYLAPDMSLDLAQQLLSAALRAAEREGVALAVVVVDRAGHEVAAVRMDGTQLGGMSLARDKAFTAAAFGFPTSAWITSSTPGQPDWGLAGTLGGRAIVFPGGAPIYRDGQLVGAIGASGAKSIVDERCVVDAVTTVGATTAP